MVFLQQLHVPISILVRYINLRIFFYKLVHFWGHRYLFVLVFVDDGIDTMRVHFFNFIVFCIFQHSNHLASLELVIFGSTVSDFHNSLALGIRGNEPRASSQKRRFV